VNGVVVRELGGRADPARDMIAVDGEPIGPPAVPRTIVLHKPRGVVSTLADPQGRPTVAGLVVAAGARLYPVGRLDVNTTGLLLMTNDGTLAARILHPRHEVPRVYHAKVRGTPDEPAITRLRRGVRLEDGKTAPARVRVLGRLPTKTWLELTVREGRPHLVRRMCEAVGHPVEKLARVRLGPLVLGDLAPGAWRDLGPRELDGLRAAAGLRRRTAGAADAAPRRRARGRPPRRRRPQPGRR
jgi:pseudouridine synthase